MRSSRFISTDLSNLDEIDQEYLISKPLTQISILLTKYKEVKFSREIKGDCYLDTITIGDGPTKLQIKSSIDKQLQDSARTEDGIVINLSTALFHCLSHIFFVGHPGYNK